MTDHAGAPPPRHRVPRRIDFWFPAVVIAGVLLLSALGISGSSLPIFSPSGAPDQDAMVVDRARAIRSDEWLAWSPMKTGRVRGGFEYTQTYGMGRIELSDSWRPQLPSRSLGAALYSPFNLPLVLLPITQGFALMWWLPFVVCSLGLYAWLRAMRVGPGIALAVALLVTTAPAGVWWSGWLCQTIGAAALPCALLVAATRMWPRSPRWAIAIAVGAALAAANLPWFYQPWALPSGLFIGGTTAIWGLADARHRRAFVRVGAIAGALFLVESAVYLLHEREYYEALQDTVYPGRRRSSGGRVGVGLLFSSLFPFVLTSSKGNSLVGTNLSEVSMGWTVFFPITATTAALARRAILRDRERTFLVGTLALAAVMTSWCIVQWPTVLANVTGLSRVPPSRMAPLVGVFWLVGFALLFADANRRWAITRDVGRSGAGVVVAVTTLAAAWGATQFRVEMLPGLSGVRTWLPVILVALGVAALWTRWWSGALAGAVVISVVSGALVNPVTLGLGAIDDSHAAALVRRIDERVVDRGGGTWAADDIYVNGLLNAQGVDSLSSFNDPVDPRGWRVLDPSGRRRDVWNRFAYIRFVWEPGRGRPEIEAPVTDVVVVRADPCDPRLGRLRLRAVVSSQPLDGACLRERATFRWQGNRFRIYDRR